jgi:hypothetical protein
MGIVDRRLRVERIPLRDAKIEVLNADRFDGWHIAEQIALGAPWSKIETDLIRHAA